MVLIAPLRRIIRAKKATAHAYGRDALFKSERMRREYWKNYKDREDLLTYRNRLMLKQQQADYFNELARVEGYIGHMTHGARLSYMERNKDMLRKELGRLAVKIDT